MTKSDSFSGAFVAQHQAQCISSPRLDAPSTQPELVIIIGLSGAGKSTALHVFEDLGFKTVEGIPMELVPYMMELLHTTPCEGMLSSTLRGMAFGLDQQRPNFTEHLEKTTRLLVEKGYRPSLLFLESTKDMLLRRYATTRRPHPLEGYGCGLERAIDAEVEQLAPLRKKADMIIDTTDYSIHGLRRRILERWAVDRASLRLLKVNLISFGFKYGVPREVDMVFDLRFLPNPFFVEKLRPLSGLNKPVVNYVFGTPEAKAFKQSFFRFMDGLIPLYNDEGRYRIAVAIGCTGGKHRSVALTELLGKRLKKLHYSVFIEHRHMELG